MASVAARARLARAARTLNAVSLSRLPPLILMTDEHRLADPIPAARALPFGGAIILRHTDDNARAALAETLLPIARGRGLLLLIAGDAALAARIGADGLHLAEARAREAAHWKALRPFWLITAAAHSLAAIAAAARAGADAALLAPAFATQSHRDRSSLGVSRFKLMVRQSPIPIYALGGVNAETVRRLAATPLAGIAAIEALIPDHSP